METIHFNGTLPDSLKKGVLSIGKFDGVHFGHRLILKRLMETAERLSAPSVVLSFDPLPAMVIRPQLAPPLLCSMERKKKLVAEFNPSAFILIPTDQAFLENSASFFFEHYIREIFQARALVEGENFNFGRQREGTSSLLKSYCDQSGLEMEIIPSQKLEGRIVSSSVIRSLLREGALSEANRLLTRLYCLTGEVVHGEHRGSRLGYPTANMGEPCSLVPKEGVYAARAWFFDDKERSWPAAVNIGANPTFGVYRFKIEAHLIGFHGNCYGKTMNLEFYERIRDVIPFDSTDLLLNQLKLDMDHCMALFLDNSKKEKDHV